ncbi:MAG: hypothetical protein HW380_1633 [Magnetococcales bacterium]|nr:hypothetical protein [Magnetococcales bacterium]
MPSAEQLRSRLLKKLSELFQLDQPDLDFGFYRIMHAKAQEVQDFIGTDLLKIVADAFGDVDEARKAELQASYEKAIQTAKDFGAPNPEETEPVKKAKAALDAAKDTSSAEADVYDHLYRFFDRYYDDGDFISRRYYTRETSGKAAPFAVPYNGEEVKLHWANADQYYIKSAEYFSNFTFDLRQAKEIRAEGGLNLEDKVPLNVHFRVVEATEGEHGNVKASESNKCFFILHAENPLALTETSELVVNFEYRPDPEKTGQENTWRDKRNAEAVETILERLQAMAAADGEHGKQIAEYLRLFKVRAPTDSDKNRPVLAKYVNQYTARNTMDYFIHKDLGSFLRRELDFYIKNEVMRLDDIENAEAPAVESYLAKIKVLRKIAGKLISFLAQLEDFQKKIWLKKKFIIETNYCITLDRVPDEFYAEVVANEAQCEEWIKLFAIDEIKADLNGPGFSKPLTLKFLKANNKLVLDTRFFDEGFKARLVASIENFDEQCDGLLIHSENFQALNLLKERYCEQVKCIYIDPPYNTEQDRQQGKFIYKDSFESSSWLALMADRIIHSTLTMRGDATFFSSIDHNEIGAIKYLLESIFGRNNFEGLISWRRRHNQPNDKTKMIGMVSEYIISYAKNQALYKKAGVGKLDLTGDFSNPDNDPRGDWASKPWKVGSDQSGSRYKIEIPTGRILDEEWMGEESTYRQLLADARIYFPKNGDGNPRKKYYKSEREDEGQCATNWWHHEQFGHNQGANDLMTSLIGSKNVFSNPKPIELIRGILLIANSRNHIVLDYFAGSGTTGQAVINLNREDGGKRKYILVEMGDYFDTVLKPRIAKVVYSESWKDGKPTARHTGISHCFKYIRLESYEDTLNNLRLDHNPKRKKAVAANPALREDYMLRYLLDVETRGSQSLLNIDAFADPTAYTLDVKKSGTDEYVTRAVDLIETFNYLISLRVMHSSVPQTFQATFKRITDPELPEDQHTKLVVDGRILQEESGPWWFRKVEGWVPKDPANPNNGQREKVLIVWRKLTDDIEQDNLMLDEWFQKNRIRTRDFEFDTIYVNGSNNLPNLKLDDENWKVRLIEEEFMKRMWNTEGMS